MHPIPTRPRGEGQEDQGIHSFAGEVPYLVFVHVYAVPDRNHADRRGGSGGRDGGRAEGEATITSSTRGMYSCIQFLGEGGGSIPHVRIGE